MASTRSGLSIALLAVLGALLLGETCQPPPRTAPDGDGDLVSDWCDNCRLAANRSQADTDVADACLIPPGEESGFCRQKPGQACTSHADCLVLRGNLCDCDVDGNGVCNIDDFNDFLADRANGMETPGWGTDFNVDGAVDDLDFPPFQAGFAAGAPGEGALPASPVDGSCNPDTDANCSDPYRQGACFAMRVAKFADGSQRPWRVHEASDGCNLVPQLLVDAGRSAAATNLNNPTDALLADQSAGAVRCPNAAFGSFPSSTLCDETVACDPRDRGKPCGSDNGRAGVVTCGDVNAGARACEVYDVCESQCGYRSFDCAEQYRQNLFDTCLALTGAEREQCLPTCLEFAELYAAQVGHTVDPGEWTASDLEQQLAQCKCCPDLEPGGTQPAVCGDGVCSPQSESCHPSSCPEDCGSCALGARCLTDDDCGAGACSFRGVCEVLPAGATCGGASECRTGTCTSGLCASSCGDGFCEGTETCGTSAANACPGDCGACPVGAACGVAEDCLSGSCSEGECLGLAPLSACVGDGACESTLCDLGACAAAPKQAGADCGSDAACAGRLCDLGKCLDQPTPAGEACGRDEACVPVISVDPDLPPIGVCNLGECLGASVALGGPCDNDLACDDQEILFVTTPAICNLGTCTTWKTVAIGDACDNDLACDDYALCVEGACKATANSSGGCSEHSDCVSGLCDPNGLCVSICGDGICEGFPLELCGEDDLLRCRSDCGECLPIIAGTFGVGCKANEECASGICNFGLCLAGPNGPDTICSGDASCWSGICNFGVCTTGTTGINTPCTTNAKCASGACNFGLCVELQSLPVDHVCSTGKACESGLCNFGRCVLPLPLDAVCSASVNCASGACNFGICIPIGAVETGIPCTTNAACSSGVCGGIPALQEAADFFGIPVPGTCKEVCGDDSCEGLETCGFSNLVTTCLPDCGLCGDGAPCLGNFDCASGACNFPTCVAANSVPTGSSCTTSAACVSGRCTAGLCVPVCGDEVCDFPAELCGAADAGLQCNSDCGGCPNGTPCTSNDVCASNVCNGGLCAEAGSVGPGGICTTNGACSSNVCVVGFCAGSCGDGVCTVVPNAETCYANSCQADCGKCPNGVPCTLNADCASGRCFGLACAPQVFCGDFVCSPGETCSNCGIDCGVCPFCGDLSCNAGETCATCAFDCGDCCAPNGNLCAFNSDCCSNRCSFFTCAP